MDLYSPVSTDTLEEYRRKAVETLDDLESSAESKTEALEVLTELLPIAKAMDLASYSESDPLEALADVDMTDADYSYWYDSEDLESALREHVQDCESIPETIAEYIDWERYADDHRRECAEFEHDGTTYYAL